MYKNIFDSHAHYTDKAFNDDRKELLGSLQESGICGVINCGADLKSSREAAELSESFDYLYFSCGVHPEEVDNLPENYIDILRDLSQNEKCLAIGEIGLDYYWDDTHKEEQKVIFKRQIELALKLNKPVIIHDREAHGDSLEIISQYPELRGVFHCYSGSAEMAKELLKKGWYLGFDGPVTYKNARKTVEVLEICPLGRILIETDSPYMSPVPKRGKRNDSRNLCHIAEKIAEIKGISPEEAAKITLENGKKLFGI